MRSRIHTRLRALLALLMIPVFLLCACAPPDYGMRTQHEEMPAPPTPEEIKRCTTDPLKNCTPVPQEVADKIKDPNNLTAEDQKLLDELGGATEGQVKKAVGDLEAAAQQFQKDLEAVGKQIGADVPIANKYHAHVDLYAGNSQRAQVPYDRVKVHGLPLKWIEDHYKAFPPMIFDQKTLERRRATEAEIADLIKDLAGRPDPFGMSYTKEELDALVARTTALRAEDSKETFLGSLAFKHGDVYVVVYGKTDIVVYAPDKDVRRLATNNWVVPKVPLNIYRSYYTGKVGTAPDKTLDQRIDLSIERTLKNYRDLKDGEIAAITYMIFSIIPVLSTTVELDKKLCGQPGSSWLKVAGSFFMDVGFVLAFVPGRFAFAMMLGADGVAIGLLYLDGDPKNAEVIKWSAGFLALALVFRGGALLRAGKNVLGKVPVVTTAIRSYNALLAAFKALNALLKKKCWIWPKKVGLVPGVDAGVVVATGPEAPDAGIVVTTTEPGPDAGVMVTTTRETVGVPLDLATLSSDTMDSVEGSIDGAFLELIRAQNETTDEENCECVCTEAPTSLLDDIVIDGGLCASDGEACCAPDDAACASAGSPPEDDAGAGSGSDAGSGADAGSGSGSGWTPPEDDASAGSGSGDLAREPMAL